MLLCSDRAISGTVLRPVTSISNSRSRYKKPWVRATNDENEENQMRKSQFKIYITNESRKHNHTLFG